MKSAREEAVEPVWCRPPWSDLQEDLLRLIFGKLYFVDQSRFRAVCKGWRFLVHGCGSKEKLPWLVNRVWVPQGQSRSNACWEKELYDLYNQKTYVIREYNLPCYFDNASVLACRYGWLLFGMEEEISNIFWSFFVYNPFTRQVIYLPILDLKFEFDDNPCDINATFSSAPPTSPDCLFFVCCSHLKSGTFEISMFQYWNETWTTEYFCGEQLFLGRAQSMVYINGVLYCAFPSVRRGVFAFNVEDKQGQWLGRSTNYETMWQSLVEASSELVWASCSYDDKCKIFKLDSSGKTWIPQITLENQALFVDRTSSLLIPAVGDTSFLANKIYYHGGRTRPRVYCLLSGKRCENDEIYNCIRMSAGQSMWIEPSR